MFKKHKWISLLTIMILLISMPLSTASAAVLPATVEIPVVYRDFHGTGWSGTDGYFAHPDFELVSYSTDPGIVLGALGADMKPVYAGATGNPTTHSMNYFDMWYRDTANYNKSLTSSLTFTYDTATGNYVFSDNTFFPLDGLLFGNEQNSHNYHFTMEMHSSFTYVAGQKFTFSGDDDLFVYINNHLVIDLGGVHTALTRSINLDTLGLTPNKTYSFDLFFAERHKSESKFMASTNIEFNETVNIPVTKNWVGSTGTQAVVRLLADGVRTGDTLTLDSGNLFTDTFADLDMYNSDTGNPIIYTIEEDTVAGYESEITGNPTDGFTVTNTEIGGLKLIKVDQFENKIPGAVFEIADNDDFVGATELGTTDANGEISITGKASGVYYIREKTAPAGYTKSDEVKEVTIDKDAVAEVSFTNIKNPSFRIIKKDAATDESLSGAVFGIYVDAECTELVNDTEYTTDENGMIELALYDGVYYIRENVAPEGYELDSSPFEITIQGEQGIREITIYNTIDETEEEEDPSTGTNDYLFLVLGMIFLIAGLITSITYRKTINTK